MNKLKQISIPLLLLIVIGLAGSVFFVQEMRSSDPINEERTIGQQFTAIEMTTGNADAEIELISTDSDSAQIESIGRADDYIFEVDVTEDVLSIQANTQQKNLINFLNHSLTLTVYVPEQLYDDIQIENQNGKVQIDGIQATDTHVETDNSQVELTNIEGKTVTTTTENGRTILENIQATLTSVKSDNGKIDVFGNPSADTVIGSGDHVISLVTENGSVTVK